ncbi:alpha/beta hydrolase [Paraburkholderia solisilvae]|nr:alpha/beta hydrolase [Paraburkholderia solisilvae]
MSCQCAGAYAQEPPAHDENPGSIASADARDTLVRDLPLDGGGYQRVLFYGPKAGMRGIIVMFPGGADEIGIERDGAIRSGDNFVVRTRELWARRKYGVVIVDAIDHRSMRGQRSTAEYAAVTQTILGFAHSLSNVPVWVMGTSQGSIAAMNAASHAGPGELAGVVLTESVSVVGKSRETVFDAQPQDVRAPALIVANRDDRCWVAPPSMANEIAHAMRNAQPTVLFEQGGVARSSNDCGSRSPHGYWGIDEKVVNDIDRWMQDVSPTTAHSAAQRPHAD